MTWNIQIALYQHSHTKFALKVLKMTKHPTHQDLLETIYSKNSFIVCVPEGWIFQDDRTAGGSQSSS